VVHVQCRVDRKPLHDEVDERLELATLRCGRDGAILDRPERVKRRLASSIEDA
jgi:hypothetical protein